MAGSEGGGEAVVPLPKRNRKKKAEQREGALKGLFSFTRKSTGSIVNDGEVSSTVGSEPAASADVASSRGGGGGKRGRRRKKAGSSASSEAPPEGSVGDGDGGDAEEAEEPELPTARSELFKSSGADKRALLDAWVAAQEKRGVAATKADALGFLRTVGVTIEKVGHRQWRSWLKNIEAAVDRPEEPPDDASETTDGTGDVPALTEGALASHDRASAYERRMFNCERHGVFWKKVPAAKPVATCKKCATAKAGAQQGETCRYVALPRSEESGRGRFRCQECGHGWTSNTA